MFFKEGGENVNKMTQEEYKKELIKIQEANIQKEYKFNLRAEKNKFNKKKKIETSKFLAFYLFCLLNIIIIFAMIAMWHFSDLAYLGVLISDIAAQAVVYIIYCLKSYHGKKQEEQMKFEREKLENGYIEGVFMKTIDE